MKAAGFIFVRTHTDDEEWVTKDDARLIGLDCEMVCVWLYLRPLPHSGVIHNFWV